MISISDAVAKEQDSLDARVFKVLTSFETKRLALVKGIRNFGYSAIPGNDGRFAVADPVTATINCLKTAELDLEFLPIGITGDFLFPDATSAQTFEEVMLNSIATYIGENVIEKILSTGEACAKKMDFTVAKLNAKLGSSFDVLKKCATNFTSVNVDTIKTFESTAALALKPVDEVVKAISACKWTDTKGIDICSKTIIQLAAISSKCDTT